MKQCRTCSADFTPTRQPAWAVTFCSRECRNVHRRSVRKQNERLIKRHGMCAMPYCERLLPPGRSVFCSRVCAKIAGNAKEGGLPGVQTAAIRAGLLSASRVYWHNCQDCGATFAHRAKRCGPYTCCRPCAKARARATDARRAHKRRASGPPVLSVDELAARDGRRCHICQKVVNMSLSGRAKWGPTIDHLVPISRGGTNDADNLSLAHRSCNSRRHNTGAAQLRLAV